MRVCLEKATGKLIESQSGNAELGTLIQNAISAGYLESDIEEKYVTDAEYAVILAAQVSLDTVKQNKINEIHCYYQQALSAGFISSATGQLLEYDYTPDDRQDFQKLTLAMALGIATFPVPIGLKDNSVVNHTQEQYIQLLRDIQAFELGLKEKKRVLVAEVMAATTVEQVNAIKR
jgi:hypothetical protein